MHSFASSPIPASDAVIAFSILSTYGQQNLVVLKLICQPMVVFFLGFMLTSFSPSSALCQPIKKKKEGEEKRMTQEEMLLEAAETGFKLCFPYTLSEKYIDGNCQHWLFHSDFILFVYLCLCFQRS
jgi:hypothetical protein